MLNYDNINILKTNDLLSLVFSAKTALETNELFSTLVSESSAVRKKKNTFILKDDEDLMCELLIDKSNHSIIKITDLSTKEGEISALLNVPGILLTKGAIYDDEKEFLWNIINENDLVKAQSEETTKSMLLFLDELEKIKKKSKKKSKKK